VAGVFADHVQVEELDGKCLVAAPEHGIQRDVADRGVCEPAFLQVLAVLELGTVGVDVVEIDVRARRIERLDCLFGDPDPEPDALDFGHMP
jgi:hypothetical protein